MEDSVRAAIRSQFLAALAMLGQTIERCPAELWTAPSRTTPFWQVAYHALFYAHFYLAPRESEFEPWPKGRPGVEFMGRVPWPPHEPVDAGEPYTREDLLEYRAVCCAEVERRIAAVDLAAPAGFDWLPLQKLELQLYSIRHVQQHAGELADRLGQAGLEIDWVGQG